MGGTLGGIENQMLMGGSANPYQRADQLAGMRGHGNAGLFAQQTAVPRADFRQDQLSHLVGLLSQIGQLAAYHQFGQQVMGQRSAAQPGFGGGNYMGVPQARGAQVPSGYATGVPDYYGA